MMILDDNHTHLRKTIQVYLEYLCLVDMDRIHRHRNTDQPCLPSVSSLPCLTIENCASGISLIVYALPILGQIPENYN